MVHGTVLEFCSERGRRCRRYISMAPTGDERQSCERQPAAARRRRLQQVSADRGDRGGSGPDRRDEFRHTV